MFPKNKQRTKSNVTIINWENKQDSVKESISEVLNKFSALHKKHI